MSNNPLFFIRDSLANELPAIVECAQSAFTTFTVFGPPWYDDAGILPAKLAAAYGGGGLSRVTVGQADGTILGQAQWSLGRQWLAGGWRDAAWLAPLSVHAAHQNSGIGGALMRDGIALLRARGVELLLILGHERYYPRFGLLTGCHGRHGLTVPRPEALAADPEGWTLRPFRLGDEIVCLRLWHNLAGGVDGAIDPGPGLMPWLSNTKGIVSCILEHDGTVVGHARFDTRTGAASDGGILRFLAASPQAAAVLAGRIIGWTGWTGERLFLPLSPVSVAVRALLGPDIQAVSEWWDAGMALALQEAGGTGPVSGQLKLIRERVAPPLFVEWSPVFDF